MGNCQAQKKKQYSLKPTNFGSEQSHNFTTIKQHIDYFNQINLEQLNYPDLSILLGHHIKNYKIVDEGKTWVALTQIINLLNEKSTTNLILNLNTINDSLIQLIYTLKQLAKQACKVQEVSVNFDEDTVELYHYFLHQLIQISVEVLIAVNTLNEKGQHWWNDEYFNWRRSYIQSTFKLKCPMKCTLDTVNSLGDFILLLQMVAKKLSGVQKQESQELEFRAQQECLQQFYGQMRKSFLQAQHLGESISLEKNNQSQNISQKLRTHIIQPQKKQG